MSLPPFDHDTHTKFTETPNTLWMFGQKIESMESGQKWLEGEEQGWKVINTDEDTSRLYPLMISAIVPRPIAFISSVSENGVENLTMFSWFNMVTHNLPLVSFSCSNTLRIKGMPTNVRNGLGFTINIISKPFVENANAMSINALPEFDEWTISRLTKVPSIHVKALRVKESVFSVECEFFQLIDVTHPISGEITTTLILAHVKYIHIRKDVLNKCGIVDITKYKPITCLGDILYTRISDAFRLPRPVWEQEKGKIEQALENNEQS
ncbi:hypothetical protein BKA82DRAFT_4205337 [Pisolithus tinctorius]|nr:hypothetical protein BKA82DRAFT_4205337 [Pisolithus tinctorius]